MSFLPRVALATVLVAGLLMAPAVVNSPESTASAQVVYEDQRGTVIDCGYFYYCTLYLSRSDVKALAYEYDNELDLAQALTAIACGIAAKPVAAALCSTIFEYVVETHVRDELRRLADEGKCASITYVSVLSGLYSRTTDLQTYDGELCRE